MGTIKKWMKTKFGIDTIVPKTLVEAVYDQEGNNLNQILKGKYTADTVADEYNSEYTYSIGDYTIYNNKLYKCVTDIKYGEEFTSDHWELTSCENEISQLKGLLKELNSKFKWKLLTTLHRNESFQADMTQYNEILAIFSYADSEGAIRKYSIHVPVLELTEIKRTFTTGSYQNDTQNRAYFIVVMGLNEVSTTNYFAYHNTNNVSNNTTVNVYVR